MNAIRVIHPYKSEGIWKFDDPRHGLDGEPFVAGADVAIERLAANLPDAEHGFTLLFSDQPFPGFQAEYQRRREEYGGHWYYSPHDDLEGWLCPALFHYFDNAPDRLYVQVKSGPGAD